MGKSITVIYNVQTLLENGFVFNFTYSSTQGCIVAEAIPQKSFYFTDCDESRYYLVDPGNTKDSCNPSHKFKQKVNVVASPDDQYWGESHDKNTWYCWFVHVLFCVGISQICKINDNF
jgi:hypothetical protein